MSLCNVSQRITQDKEKLRASSKLIVPRILLPKPSGMNDACFSFLIKRYLREKQEKKSCKLTMTKVHNIGKRKKSDHSFKPTFSFLPTSA